MKRFFNIIWEVIKNAILVIIAIYLLKYLLIPAIIMTTFLSFFKEKIGNGFMNIAYYFRRVAISVNQLGNIICADLFNLLLIKKYGYKFGNPDETVSSVLGKNQKLKTLSMIGKILDLLLNRIEKDHTLMSIEKDEISDIK